MKTNGKALRYLTLLVTAAVMFMQSSKAQTLIDRDPASYPEGTLLSAGCPGIPCFITLPAISVGSDNTFIIPLLTEEWDELTISEIGHSCDELTGEYIVELINDTLYFKADKLCGGEESSSIEFRINIRSGTIADQQLFIVPIKRTDVRLVLTLDISGSMNRVLNDAGERRIDLLKSGVQMLTGKLFELSQEYDSLAITYFSSTVTQPAEPISDRFISTWSFDYSELEAEINSISASGMTAMGEGLLNAKSKIEYGADFSSKRMVFLFTDGLQNYGNQVKADGLTFYASDDSLNNYSLNQRDSISYFPVATWAAGTQPELLNAIAEESGGEVLFAFDGDELMNWFDGQLTNMLGEGSPQIVTSRSGYLTEESTRYDFHINDLVSALLIETRTSEESDIRILYEDTDITTSATSRQHGKSRLSTIKFPLSHNGEMIHSGGKWSIVISGESYGPYSFSVIADDHFFKYNCSTDRGVLMVGEPLNLSVNPTYRGKSPDNDLSVSAIVLKPGEDLGSLLATSPTPVMDSADDSGNAATEKLYTLMATDSSFYQAIIPQERLVNLVRSAEGLYEGTFDETEMAGFYNVIFLLDGEIQDIGRIERQKRSSVVFLFAEAENEIPEVVVDAPPPSGSNVKDYTVIKIRPKNRFGYYMGPGFSDVINLRLPGKPADKSPAFTTKRSNDYNDLPTLLLEVKDNLDGSYLLYISGVMPFDEWDFVVTVRDEVLHDYDRSLPLWIYLLLIVLILLILRVRKESAIRVILWIILILAALVILMHQTGIITIL